MERDGPRRVGWVGTQGQEQGQWLELWCLGNKQLWVRNGASSQSKLLTWHPVPGGTCGAQGGDSQHSIGR